MPKQTIDDIGRESYALFVQYKKDDYVLFVGAFATISWIESLVSKYSEDDIFTFTMVEI